MTEYQVIRSRRKTISLQLDRSGNVVVRAPLRCGEEYIDSFVRDHEDWIQVHRARLLEKNRRREDFSLSEGEPVSICGQTYTVHLVPGLKARIWKDQLILSDGNMDAAGEKILALARAQGKPWLRQRLDQWAEQMGIDYRDLKLSSARTRWGSCTRDGVIRISVWLLFAPERAIDYVLVHELCHRRHFDHSREFWALVARYMPDYPAQKKTLRAFQEEPFLQSLAVKRGSA